MSRFLDILTGLSVAGLVALSAVPVQAGGACRPDEVSLRGAFGTARFNVEIADDPEERSLGLMFRDKLAASSGMLFIYPQPGEPRFWMKNTLIALDMLYIAPNGRVQFIRHMAKPGDLTPVSGGPGVQYVLEIRGGLARALGLTEGAELRHPALDPALALWACPEGE